MPENPATSSFNRAESDQAPVMMPTAQPSERSDSTNSALRGSERFREPVRAALRQIAFDAAPTPLPLPRAAGTAALPEFVGERTDEAIRVDLVRLGQRSVDIEKCEAGHFVFLTTAPSFITKTTCSV